MVRHAFAAAALLACAITLPPTPARSGGVLGAYDPDDASVTRVALPRGLEEASGLAVDARGRVFTHGDERARIVQIDARTGAALKSFSLGIDGDFEGLAILGERFFLVTSAGSVFEFADAPDGAAAPYRSTRTRLGKLCEVEGLAADAAAGRLIFACKRVRGREGRDRASVYTLPVDGLDGEPVERVRIPFSTLEALGLRSLRPSGVALSPDGLQVILVASRERVLVEISSTGRAVAALRLDEARHPQPEGVAFDARGALLIVDEGDGGPGRVTRMPPRGAPP